MKALDLFCGAGGLALGFKNSGFNITGVDKSRAAGEAFRLNSIGNFIRADLSQELVIGDYDIILGGPPCKPWATVNTVRRGANHPDYELLSKFFDHIEHCEPLAFLMENVPAIRNTPIFQKLLIKISELGYSVAAHPIIYSDFGAPTSRRRFITFGIKNGNAEKFFEGLFLRCHEPKTVRHAIWYLREKEKGEEPDHEWPELKTIEKYMKYYITGKYGWYILKWDEPARSFGNIKKTYILHPDSFNGGLTRVISVREAWDIMGFDSTFQLPRDRGLGVKYQMAADSVSPCFSRIAGDVVKEILAE